MLKREKWKEQEKTVITYLFDEFQTKSQIFLKNMT